MTEFPVTPGIVHRLFRHAVNKGIARGKPEAVLSRLETMARDLFPTGGVFFTALFAAPGRVAGDAGDDTPRTLGDAFGRAAFATPEERRLAGSYYTPAAIIDAILDLVWDDILPDGALRNKAVCDPAMGSGFFLLRLIDRLLETHPPAKIRAWAKTNLFGVDLDPGAVFMTRACLWLALSDGRGEFAPDPGRFRCGDSLLGPAFSDNSASDDIPPPINWPAAFPEIARKGGFDAIVGNPPYEVLTNFSRRPERAALARALRDSGFYRDALAGQINLYRCFIERSLALLRPGGVLSMVVPLSLARDAAALPLRRRLIEENAARSWLLFGERDNIFPGVTQSACIFKATALAGKTDAVDITLGGETTSLATGNLAKWTDGAFSLPAIGPKEAELWAWLWKNMRARLGDVCDMRVGEVDQTAYRRCMADNDTGCLLARGAHLAPFRLDTAALPGKERFLRLDEFLEMKGAAAAACRERAGKWRVVQLGIRNMHSRPRLAAALAPPGVYLGNSLNVYSPRGGVSLEYIAGLLNSRLLDWLFCLASGNNNINLHEMRRLPAPDAPAPEAVAAVEDAYKACAETAESGKELLAARERLDDAVAVCYGVGDEWRTAL